MSNLDFFYLLRELSVLKGARLAKVYGFAPDAPKLFRLKFKSVGGELNLHVDLNFGMWFSKYLREPPKQPSAFVAKLRKDLENAVLSEIRQLNFDRVVSLVFSTKFGKRVLIAEFVGSGNLLLLDEEGKIIQAVESRGFASRKLHAGVKYAPPPCEKKNPRELGEGDLRELRGGVVPVLFKKINLSPFYLEEVCARAGIASDKKIENLKVEQHNAIVKHCKKLFEEEFKPIVYKRDERTTAFAPFKLKKFEGFASVEFKSFSEALDAYYANVEFLSTREKAIKAFEEELRELRNLLSEQERASSALSVEAGEKKMVGDWIKENLSLVESAIVEAGKLKKGVSISEVEQKIVSLNEKIKKASVIGRELVLDVAV